MKKRTLTAQNRRKQLPSENKELSTQFLILHVSFIYVTLHSSAVLPVELVSVKQKWFFPHQRCWESFHTGLHFILMLEYQPETRQRRAFVGPSSGQKAVSCAGVLQLLHMFLLLFHCPGYERVGALTALELSAGEYRAKNPEITQIYNPLSDIFICLFKVCEFSEKVDALRTHKLLAWELEFAQQFSSAEKTPSFQLVGLNYKTQKERRGRQAGSRERHGGRAREKQRSKKTVCA